MIPNRIENGVEYAESCENKTSCHGALIVNVKTHTVNKDCKNLFWVLFVFFLLKGETNDPEITAKLSVNSG